MKKHSILTSILIIVMCLSLTVGGTFALFTSQSEVNIAVTSGTVEVVASATALDKGSELGSENASFAVVEDGKGGFALEGMVIGDYATFEINAKNKSDVAIKYQIETVFSGDLSPALSVEIKNSNGDVIANNYKSAWIYRTVEEGEVIETYTVKISLPTSGSDEIDSQFMGKTANVALIVNAVQGNAATYDEWDGVSKNVAWFFNDPTATEYELTSAEQFAGFMSIIDKDNDVLPVTYANTDNSSDPWEGLNVTFEGVTVKLNENIDLSGKLFNPIGSYRKNNAFKGTFDGQGHTIKNLSQNTWELDNGYYYGDLGLGLFGKVENATIKNLVMDGATISGESAICGVVAATAYGDCVFENITVTNSKCNDYQYYAGGVVGWASGEHVYKNIVIDESTVIGSQWGDFGNASGGVIGGCGSSAEIKMQDCTIACRIDAVNDIVSAYQWYCYRNCGMLIGTTNNTETDDAVTKAAAPNLTCDNVTVIYGDWANYTYCKFAGTGYPYVRVQAGVSVDAYSNVRYGHPTDANGNTVVDDNHVHNDGEDHHLLLAFDQLYGGDANHRYCQYGVATHPGVTVIYNNK